MQSIPLDEYEKMVNKRITDILLREQKKKEVLNKYLETLNETEV